MRGFGSLALAAAVASGYAGTRDGSPRVRPTPAPDPEREARLAARREEVLAIRRRHFEERDRPRIDAAQAKRERKAAKRLAQEGRA